MNDSAFRLIPIERDGELEEPVANLPEVGLVACAWTAELYESVGFEPPWIGYVAVDEGVAIGTCSFKGPPVPSDWTEHGRVEIAYFTFPGGEDRGHATEMARALVALAREEDPDVVIAAQTLPEQNASTRVLEKVGFILLEEVDHPDDGFVWEWRLPPKSR